VANYKVTHFFTDHDTQLGWSESWFVTADNFDQANNQGRRLASSRIIIASPVIELTYMRVAGNQPDSTPHTIGQGRNATLQRMQMSGQAIAGADKPADWTTTAAKVRFSNQDRTVFVTRLFRGLPDAWWADGLDTLAQARINAWLQGDFLNALNLAAATIRHLNPVVPPATIRIYQYTSITRGTYEGYTRRATGRPFNLPRGRKSKRRV